MILNYSLNEMQKKRLEQVLSGGLPTVRNKEAGYGQGDEVKTVDNTLVEYAIHLSATNIVYLVSLLKK